MTPEFKAAKEAWEEYNGAKRPSMPRDFSQGFEDGVKWERKRKAVDWAADDAKVRALARPHLKPEWIDGGSHYVPDMVAIVEKLVWWIEARKREDHERSNTICAEIVTP
jgi:hypothetical protein